jgi:hypothetical protein
MAKLPVWVKKLKANSSTITIDSLTALRLNLGESGGLSNRKLEYEPPPVDYWLLPMPDPKGKVSQIFVNFTFTNGTQRVLTGMVSGFIDNVALSQTLFGNLAIGASVSGRVSFDPPKWPGRDYLITLTFREFPEGPVPISIVTAKTTAVLFAVWYGGAV